MEEPADQSRPPRRRFALLYVALALAVAAVVGVIVSVASDQEAEPEIAGGYDVRGAEACLGSRVDVKQSGQFVNLQNAEDSISGSLRFEDPRLDGGVKCLEGDEAELEARVTGGRVEGELDGRPFTATFERDPPTAGSQRPRTPSSIDGEYRLVPRSSCLGGLVELEEHGSGLELLSGGNPRGELSYSGGEVEGDVECNRGGAVAVSGEAADRQLNLTLTPVASAGETAGEAERLTAEKRREFGETLAAFFIAVAIVMLAARAVGYLAVKARQPRVMGEVVAGIALGPTLLGAISPGLQGALFPQDIIPLIGVVANLGLIFYMFLVGLEVDPAQLRGRIAAAAAISNTSVALPMALGLAVALPIYGLIGPDEDFVAFALFMGVAMSITAFPVLARILVERRMLKRPVGALALACAAIDDVTAWFLIALATAVAAAGSGLEVLTTVALAVAFCLFMGFAVRPLLGRVSGAYDEAGRIPGGWIALIFAGVLLSAYTTETIGIALIFGGFVMGLIMPRRAELTEDVTRRIEDFVVTLLLPLFFAFTGLRTDIGLLDRPELLLITLGLIAVAIVGKLFGAMLAARISGFAWRPAAVIGTLMNTRGLTELIVLNLALEKGVISEALFAMLVIMALVTTFMAGPALRLLDPRNELGAPVEEELDEAREEQSVEHPTLAVPERSILLAPQTDAGLAQLRSLAEPLARSEPPRELILARLVRPPRGAAVRGGLQTENRLLAAASAELADARRELAARHIAGRGVAFITSDAGADLARLAAREEVDLLLVDGRRPLLGEGVPRGDVGTVLREAPCDVAVLVSKEAGVLTLDNESPVVVPFGGTEHDWSALELGAWMASARGVPLKLLGAAGTSEEGPRLSRMLGDASLLVQQYAGVAAEPLMTESGGGGILEVAATAGLLVVGLSDRWQQEGLGPVRSEIARAAPAPILFVRRGQRPGALAPRDDVTRFSWSRMGSPGT